MEDETRLWLKYADENLKSAMVLKEEDRAIDPERRSQV